ncbi:MAG: hypothetical protein O3C15_00725 [Proteobacteria bacterium]|nr:hypothetical protein [Pseudomonadota bacterium]
MSGVKGLRPHHRLAGATLTSLLIALALSSTLLATLVAISAQLITASRRAANEADFVATVGFAMEAIGASASAYDWRGIADRTIRPCALENQPLGVWVVAPDMLPCTGALPNHANPFALLTVDQISCGAACVNSQVRRLWYRRDHAWISGDDVGALMVRTFGPDGSYGRGEMLVPGLSDWRASTIRSGDYAVGITLDMRWRASHSVGSHDQPVELSFSLLLQPGLIR